MFKLLVLITFISGISTRGVPVADDINGQHVEPERTETDNKDRTSEHVTFEECEDCGKVSGNGEHIGDGIPGTQNIILDKNSDPNVLPTTSKPRVNKSVKPFLTFHRIRVNVNRGDTDYRKLGRKDRRRHNLRNSHVTSKTIKTKFSDNAESTHASNVKKTTIAPSKAGEKFEQSRTEVETNRKFEKDLDSQKENTVSHEEKPTETVRQGNHERKTNGGLEQEGKPKNNVKHVDKIKPKDADVPNLNVKQTVVNKKKENVVLEEQKVQLDTISSKENGISKNVKNKNEKTDQVVGKSKDGKDSLYHVGATSKVTDKNISVNGNVVKLREGKNSEGQIVEKFKDKKHSEDSLVVKQKDEKSSTDRSSVKSKGQLTTTDHTLLKPKDDKGSVDHVIPIKAGDRWSRKGLSQVPDVERLERRLHPTVDAPVQDIIQSIKNMLRLIQSSLHRVDDDYRMIQNTTRWKYMVGVREQLTELSEKNDEIYDVVMETALLTKEIYRKAHERKHPRVNVEAMAVSYKSRLNTGMHSQMHTTFYVAQRELEEANQLLEQIKASRRQKDSLMEEKMRMYHIVRDRLPLRSLHDLHRRADQTIKILTAAQPLTRRGDKRLLYAHMKNGTAINMRRANELMVEGNDVLRHARNVLMENKEKVQEHGYALRSQSSTGSVPDMPFDSDRMELFVAWDKAKDHADELAERAAEIHMKLVPLIQKGKDAIASRKGVGYQKVLDQSVVQLKETVKALLNVLDQIRINIGEEEFLTERCKVLQNAVFFRGGPIICDETIYGSGEGSGDFDDTLTDMEDAISVTSNGKSTTDISITKVNATDKVIKATTNIPHESSKINDIDDEDRVQELRLKLTEKTTPVTTSPPSTTTLSTTTESDSDIFFDPFGWLSDEPADDEIIIDSDDETMLSLVRVNKTLNEHIRERLYNYSKGSKDLLEKAEAGITQMNEISLTWQKMKNISDTFENRTLGGISLVSKWKAERSYFKAVHDRIVLKSEDISIRKGIVEAQCSNAVDIANKKVKTMNELLEKRSKKAKHAVDPKVYSQAESQVKLVVDNVNEITRLKQLYPSPCWRLQTLDRKIRTNMTELRQKIQKAKLLASSLQIAVAVPKKEYLEFPIPTETQESHPLTSQVQIMLKHSGSDGRLVSLHVGESESLTLEVKKDALTVTQSLEDDEKSLSLYENKIENKWYLIQLKRFATSYNVTMFGDDGVLGKIDTSTIGDYRALTPDLLPTALRVGASGKLDACALGLEINGRSLNMFYSGGNETTAIPCASQGRWTTHQQHLLLDGSGYALISWNDLPRVRTLKSAKFSFNPRSDGTVVFLQPTRLAAVIDVYVEKGHLIVHVNYRNFESKLKSTMQVYSTDLVLEIVFKDGRTSGADVLLNGKSDVFKSSKGKKREMKTDSQTLFIGGIPMEDSSMVGCVKSLELNGEIIPFHNIYEGEGNDLGTCHETECVKFVDDSVPIEIVNQTLVQSIHIAVKRGSLGPILTYSKQKKFNLIVSLNTEGLFIEETIKDDTEDISLNGDSDFIFMAIQDDIKEERVSVTVGEATETFSYKKGGWGGWGNEDSGDEDDGPVSYTVSIGTSTDDSPPFIGTIQNFIIDGRPVELLNYVETNKLGRCQLDPAPRKLETEKPDRKGITCQ